MRYHLNAKTWTVELSETVPAGCVAISPVTAMLLAVTLGGLFVVFLPAIGLWLAVKTLVARPLASLARAVFAPAPALGVAHFIGTNEKSPAAAEDSLVTLQAEVDERR